MVAKELLEEWRDVDGYEGLYQVSNLGRVKSLDVIRYHGGYRPRLYRGRILKLGRLTKANPYYNVSLWSNNSSRPKYKRVHVLVAEAFLGPRPSSRHTVNHNDGDKSNNKLKNLEWVTFSRNSQHAWDIGLQPVRVVTEESHQRRSLAHSGKKQSMETREKKRQSMLGKNKGPISEEHKQKISKSLLGKPGQPIKLSVDKVILLKKELEIRKDQRKYGKYAEIAKMFGVVKSTVINIEKGVIWKHVQLG